MRIFIYYAPLFCAKKCDKHGKQKTITENYE